MTNRVIAIAGAKGSPGCSFLALALARCLAGANISTLLIDADAEGGGLAAMLESSSSIPLRELGGTGLDHETVRMRYKKGMTIEQMVSPKKRHNQFDPNV